VCAGKKYGFREDGFAVVPDLLSADEIENIVQRIRESLKLNKEIIDIAEPGPGKDFLADTLCIHHIHKICAEVRQLAASPEVVSWLRRYIGDDIKCIQTQMFIKPPGFPGNAWHQDEGPIPTRDGSLVALWIALEDATIENGCLNVIPGSHRRGYLYPTRRHNRSADFDFDNESYGFDLQNAVPVELAAGSAVFFSGYLVHGSQPNRSAGTRQALTVHYMNAYSLLPWKGQSDYRDFLMVSGEDPYTWKGKQELSIPHLREWPASSPVGSALDLTPEVRDSLARGVACWSHDEPKALSLIRQAIRVLDAD
jgi:phytanoyl-CoA hydroxylase